MLLNIIQTFTFISGYDYLAHGKTVRYSSSVSVCLSVCLSTYISEKARSKLWEFRNFSVCVIYGRGLVLL